MSAHHTVLSLTTQSSTFFGDAHFPFADGLNTFMAGRGSGKTALFYLLRYAIGAAIPEAYAKEFDIHVRDVLGPGTVTVKVRTRHGVVYTVSRAYGEPPKIRNEAGELVDISLDSELFRIDAYAAKELEHMASSPSAQLTLLDRMLPPEEMRRIARALDDVERRLALSGAEIDRLSAEIEVDEESEGGRPALLEALKGLAPVDPHSDGELTRAEARRPARGREHAAMKGLAAEVVHVQRALEQLSRDAQRRLSAAALADLERAGEPIGPLFTRAHDAVRRVAGALEVAAGRLGSELTRASEAVAVESRALLAVHDKEDEAYKALVVRTDSDRDRAVQREALHRQRDALDILSQRLASRRSERDRKQAAHAALVAERAALLDERWTLRDGLSTYITDAVQKKVRVTVKRGGLVKPYLELLYDMVQGAGLSRDLVQDIADGVPPEELYAAALQDDPNPILLVDRIKSAKTARAHKVLAALRASGRLRELECCRLEDMPLIELKVNGDYQPSSRVSTGQKVTCLLPLLLLPSANVLLVDQIEDHLDNRFIFEVLVKTLLEAKKHRQFFFISHNANVGVLGNAERAFEFAVRDGMGVLAAFGDVEEMRERLESCLEGGREAFLLRSERYGHTPKRPRDDEPENDLEKNGKWTPQELRLALDGAADADALRLVVQACAARLRAANEDDRYGLVDTLHPLLAHPSEKVRRAMADACDAFPGDLFEESFERLLADHDHYVCAAARRAGERRSVRQKATGKRAAAGRFAAETASEIAREHGAQIGRLATQHAKRAVEQYLECMAHESTKLDDAIQGALDSLDAGLAKPEATLASLRALSATLRSRIALQRSLLRRAREYARTVRPVFAPERVASMVDEARAHLVARLGERAGRLAFTADVDPSLVMHADRHAMIQAIQNLLQNAVEAYAADAASLAVTVTGRSVKKGTAIELRVEDRGVGMGDEAKASLLIPFHSNKPGGSGIGFLMARKMIEEVHGGTLAVESARGVGTTLLLTLPARQPGIKDRL